MGQSTPQAAGATRGCSSLNSLVVSFITHVEGKRGTPEELEEQRPHHRHRTRRVSHCGDFTHLLTPLSVGSEGGGAPGWGLLCSSGRVVASVACVSVICQYVSLSVLGYLPGSQIHHQLPGTKASRTISLPWAPNLKTFLPSQPLNTVKQKQMILNL